MSENRQITGKRGPGRPYQHINPVCSVRLGPSYAVNLMKK